MLNYKPQGLELNIESIHPETPDGYSVVFIWETSNFSLLQGNQGVARRRTSARRTIQQES